MKRTDLIHFNSFNIPEINGWEIPGSLYQGKMQFATVEDAQAYLDNFYENQREDAKTFFETVADDKKDSIA